MQPQRNQASPGSPGDGSILGRSIDHVLGLVRWFGVRRIVGVVAVVVAAVAGGWWLLRDSPEPPEARLPLTTTTKPEAVGTSSRPDADGSTGTLPATTAPAFVVVHVAGAVVRPGVIRLASGARVLDAVEAAGGPVVGADADALNLAAPCVDGTRIYVPRLGEVVSTVVPSGSTDGPALRVNVNSASASDLDALPGIGPSLAQAIVAYREANGPFRTLEALLGVPGVGPSKLQQLRSLVAV